MEENRTPQGNGKTIAALVLGIVAVASIVIPSIGGFVGLVCAIVGLILSMQERKVNPSGMATAAFILCIIAIGLDVLALVACTALVSLLGIGLWL